MCSSPLHDLAVPLWSKGLPVCPPFARRVAPLREEVAGRRRSARAVWYEELFAALLRRRFVAVLTAGAAAVYSAYSVLDHVNYQTTGDDLGIFDLIQEERDADHP